MQHIAAVMLLSKEDGHKNTGGREKKHSTTRTSTTIRKLRKDASSSGVPITRSSSTKSGRSSLKTKEGKSHHSFKSSNMSKTKRSKKTKAPRCDPEDVNLADYPQWRAEQGYWIGEYTFLQGNGSPFVSGSWNYPYGNYKGFITGNISG
jgi:hypothetical protein